MGPWGRNVLCVSIAETADAAHGRHALFKGREPAIGAATTAAAIVRTPRIVLRLCRRAHHPCSHKHSCHRQQNFHRIPPKLFWFDNNPAHSLFVPSTASLFRLVPLIPPMAAVSRDILVILAQFKHRRRPKSRPRQVQTAHYETISGFQTHRLYKRCGCHLILLAT